MNRYAAWLPSWLAPGTSLTDVELEGELLVARVRLILAVAVFFVMGVVGATRDARSLVDFVALIGTGMLVVLALGVWSYVRKGGARPWVPFATSAFDVTFISAIAVGYVIVGRGDVAVNSRVAFPAYFLALGATCLRYDVRICVMTGLMAMAQYTLIVAAGVNFIPGVPADVSEYYGRVVWSEQFGRLFLLAAGTVLSVAIVARVRRLRLLSIHDGLTGLYNRTYFDERVAEELLRARRYSRPLTIGVLDLDHFKRVNDKYGHAAGDEALRRFADVLRESFRRTDIVARYGGEEFAIALPETDAAESEAKLEQIRRQVEATPVRVGDGTTEVHLTFSAGVAHYPEDGDAAPDLVRMSDANLMSAKREGRNRIRGRRQKRSE